MFQYLHAIWWLEMAKNILDTACCVNHWNFSAHDLNIYMCMDGRPHIGANGVSWLPWKNGWKIKKRKHAKKSSFLNGVWGKWYEWWLIGHADAYSFIQMYFRMHHFVVSLKKFSMPQVARGHWPPKENPADALVCMYTENNVFWAVNLRASCISASVI